MSLQDVVIVDRGRVSDRLRRLAADVCDATGATPLDWDGGEALPELTHEPVLVLSMLQEGERRLPDNAARVMSRFLPDVPLVLATEEQLVRPCVLLQGGRVVLLGAPLTDLRVRARLRSILLERRAGRSPTDRMHSAAPLQTLVNVSQLGRAFVASVAHEPDGSRAPALPIVVQQVGRGLTGFLRPAGSTRVQLGEATSVADALTTQGSEAVASLPGELRDQTTLIHLSLATDQWVFHLPRSDVKVALSSPHRAPSCFDVTAAAARSGTTSIKLPARPGDLVWAGAEGQAVLAGPLGLPELMLDGGPALVRALEMHSATQQAQMQCLIVELR